MRNAIETTIDSAGRVVLPKAVRDQAGILPGTTLRITVEEGKIEIEPVTREVRIVQRGPLRVAVPVDEGPPLTEEAVERVRLGAPPAWRIRQPSPLLPSMPA